MLHFYKYFYTGSNDIFWVSFYQAYKGVKYISNFISKCCFFTFFSTFCIASCMSSY